MNKMILDMVTMIVNSDIPMGTRTRVVQHYLLPHSGMVKAPVEVVNEAHADERDASDFSIERPSAEDIEIENDPIAKAEYEDTERLMENVK